MYDLISLKRRYSELKSKGLKLDISRGKPCTEQLDLSMDMLNCTDYLTEAGFDCRNYGLLEGIPEARHFFANLMDCDWNEVIVGGNSSLNLMYFILQIACLKGFKESKEPLFNCKNRKFLCPCPGYDRHFKVTEYLGFELIPIRMTESGPDMDEIEEMVEKDDSIKGVWCIPLFSNPDGYVYSDETGERFAKLCPKADDFKIFWDNAYLIHGFTEKEVKIPSLLRQSKKYGNEDRVFMFSSTSKMTFPGSGVAAVAASRSNIEYLLSGLLPSLICFDKMNQLRHVLYFRNVENLKEHMKKQGRIISEHFDLVFDKLDKEFGENKICSWTKPNGGYFLSLYVHHGTAKRVIELCKECGVTLTNAGAAFPYGKDFNDSHIRLAPTYACLSELKEALEILCISIKIAYMEK